ncbi:MAG: hypothetical protein AAFP20_17110 [Cyanobacteria bacterium J06614_10]
MDSAGFDSTRFTDWLLVGSFVCLSVWGLWLSRRWKVEARLRRTRAELAGRLWMELHGKHTSDISGKLHRKSAAQNAPFGKKNFRNVTFENTAVEERFTPRRSVKR